MDNLVDSGRDENNHFHSPIRNRLHWARHGECAAESSEHGWTVIGTNEIINHKMNSRQTNQTICKRADEVELEPDMVKQVELEMVILLVMMSSRQQWLRDM